MRCMLLEGDRHDHKNADSLKKDNRMICPQKKTITNADGMRR